MKNKLFKLLPIILVILAVSCFCVNLVNGKYIISQSKKLSLDLNANFYAKFNAEGGTITSTSGEWYEVNDDNATKMVEVGKAIGFIPEVQREGYSLVNWRGSGFFTNEYKEIEYIQSTGSQYLELDYYPTEKIVIDMKCTGSFRLGELKDTSGKSYGQYWIGYNQFGYSNSYVTYTYSWNNNTVYNYYCDRNKMYVNNELVATVPDHTDNTFTSDYKMHLFATTYASGVQTSNIGEGKCYYFKIYEDNELKMHLVPCIETKTNKVGMYDIVNSRFYSNANKSSGSNFVAGPEYSSLYNKVINEETIFEETNDIEYKASWQPNSYTLTLKLNDDETTPATGANDGDTILVKYDARISELPDLKRYGHNFLGWFDDVENGNQYKNEDTIDFTEDKTLYAHWETKKIKINFNVVGGNELPDDKKQKEIYFGEEIGELPIPEKEGYKFKGWYVTSIPIEYSMVEYLEGKGNQCIILDYYPTEKICLDYVFEGDFITGELNGTSGHSNGQFWISSGQYGYSNNFTVYSFTRQAGTKYHVTTDLNNLYYDENIKATVSDYTSTFVSPFKLPIFAIRHDDNLPDEIKSGKCYSYKVIEEGKAIIDLIPVVRIEDTKPGMYDVINDDFYVNVIDTTTDFGYGDIISSQEYVGDMFNENTVIDNENDFALYAFWEIAE